MFEGMAKTGDKALALHVRETLKFFDDPPESAMGHATAVVGVLGEDMAAGLFSYCAEANGGKAEVMQGVKVVRGGRKDPWLDRMPAGRQRVEYPRLGVSERTHGGTNGVGEVGQHRRIESVGLGQRTGGPGEVANPARVDHHHRQRRRSESRHQRQFQTTRCLQQHHGGTYLHHLGNQFLDAGLVLRRGPSLSRRPDGNIHLRFRDINAYVSRVLFHLYLLRERWPVLARYGLDWPRQLFGLCL